MKGKAVYNCLMLSVILCLLICFVTTLSFAQENVESTKSNIIIQSWRNYYIPNGLFASDAGNFENLPDKDFTQNMKFIVSGKQMPDIASFLERIVSDEIFFFNKNGAKYNNWACLEKLEGNFETGSVPNLIVKPIKFEYIEANYGKAHHKGQFRFSNEKVAERDVFWYGHICFIVDSNSEIRALGGWPSRIGAKRPVALNPLPEYDWSLSSGGQNVVKLHNPKPHGVFVGVRTKDAVGNLLGFDGNISPESTGTFQLPPGKYDLYIAYDTDAKALFQGDSFELKTKADPYSSKITEINITLSEESDGTYSIRRIK